MTATSRVKLPGTDYYIEIPMTEDKKKEDSYGIMKRIKVLTICSIFQGISILILAVQGIVSLLSK